MTYTTTPCITVYDTSSGSNVLVWGEEPVLMGPGLHSLQNATGRRK